MNIGRWIFCRGWRREVFDSKQPINVGRNVNQPVKLPWAKPDSGDWEILARVAQCFERHVKCGGRLPRIQQQTAWKKLLKVCECAGATTRSGHADLPKTAGAQANKNGGLPAPALILKKLSWRSMREQSGRRARAAWNRTNGCAGRNWGVRSKKS